MKRLFYIFILLAAVACKKSKTADPDPNPDPSNPVEFAKGADISWVTQMEAAGRKFYNAAGVEKDCFQLMKDLGINAIRLRAWVDPAGGYNNTTDVVAKAVRAKALGMKIMLDFHYSDTWADPGHQTKPVAWNSLNFAQLKTAVESYTSNVLNIMKTNGVTPTWVQIGNETNDGMLWPDGKASTNMNQYAQLFISGYNAVKAVDNTIKVIVHVSNGWDNGLFRWNLDGLKNNGAQWDITGMSLYPTSANWSTLNNQCLTNMNDMVSRYGKEVMVVEIGMSWDQAAASNSFITDLISKVKLVNENKGIGVFYWEPQSYNNWQGYTLGAFDNNGKPTIAMNAFN